LLLLKQLFSVSRAMRIAIWIGIAITVVLYTESAILSSYYASVKARHSYELLYNSIAQGVGGTALDTYIFILPLRQIYHLNLSKRRKIHILAVFATAAL
jgi:hypothetical protein